MGKIKKITENELVGGTQNTDVYPVTSVKAVYDESNERLDNILNRRGVVNISTNYNADHIAEVLTLEQAIAKVPSKDRVLGFQGKFLSENGWKSYVFVGDSIADWTNKTKWNNYLTGTDIVQESGEAEDKAMSQKAVSDELSNLDSETTGLVGYGIKRVQINDISIGKGVNRQTIVWDNGKQYVITVTNNSNKIISIGVNKDVTSQYKDIIPKLSPNESRSVLFANDGYKQIYAYCNEEVKGNVTFDIKELVYQNDIETKINSAFTRALCNKKLTSIAKETLTSLIAGPNGRIYLPLNKSNKYFVRVSITSKNLATLNVGITQINGEYSDIAKSLSDGEYYLSLDLADNYQDIYIYSDKEISNITVTLEVFLLSESTMSFNNSIGLASINREGFIIQNVFTSKSGKKKLLYSYTGTSSIDISYSPKRNQFVNILSLDKPSYGIIDFEQSTDSIQYSVYCNSVGESGKFIAFILDDDYRTDSYIIDKKTDFYQGTSNGIDNNQLKYDISTKWFKIPIGTTINVSVNSDHCNDENGGYKIKVFQANRISEENLRREDYLLDGDSIKTQYKYVCINIEHFVNGSNTRTTDIDDFEKMMVTVSIENDIDILGIPYYYISDFGTCCIGNDDAIIIQRALEYIAFHGGGKLYLPNGVYNLKSERTYQGSTGNIIIPSNDNSKGRGYVEVGIIGQSFSDEEKSKYGDWAAGTDENVWEGGVLLKSFKEGSICSTTDTPFDVIGCGKTSIPTILGVSLNCNLITLSNFCVECFVAEGSYPKVNGINLCKARTVEIDNIMVYGSIPTFDQGDPTIENHYSAGILLPKEFCAPQNHISRVSVQGIWRFGIVVGEHNVCENLEVFNAISALAIGKTYHASQIGRVITQACRYQLEALDTKMLGYDSAKAYLGITQFDIEYNNNQKPYQCNYRGFVNDKKNLINGKLNYNIVRSSGVDGGFYGDSSFKKIGGTNMQCFSLSKPIQESIYVDKELKLNVTKEISESDEIDFTFDKGTYIVSLKTSIIGVETTLSTFGQNKWWEQGKFTNTDTSYVDLFFIIDEVSMNKMKIEVSKNCSLTIRVFKLKSLEEQFNGTTV